MFELLGITLAQTQHFLLVAARMLTLMYSVVIFSSRSVPGEFKIMMGLFLSLIASSILPVPQFLPVSFIMLTPWAFKEVLVGLGIGLATNVVLQALNFAGRIVSQSMGLSMLSMVDPTTEEDTDAVSQMLYFVTLLLLFATDAHHFIIKAIFSSYYLVPTGQATFSGALPELMLKMTMDIFVIGFKLCAPLVVVLFIEKVILALFAKVSPELNVFIISMPLGIMLGFYLFTHYWPYYNFVFWKYWDTYTQQVLTFIKLLGQ